MIVNEIQHASHKVSCSIGLIFMMREIQINFYYIVVLIRAVVFSTEAQSRNFGRESIRWISPFHGVTVRMMFFTERRPSAYALQSSQLPFPHPTNLSK